MGWLEKAKLMPPWFKDGFFSNVERLLQKLSSDEACSSDDLRSLAKAGPLLLSTSDLVDGAHVMAEVANVLHLSPQVIVLVLKQLSSRLWRAQRLQLQLHQAWKGHSGRMKSRSGSGRST